jgi:hypothetical protein
LILILMRFLANSRPLFRRVPRFADQRARASRYGFGRRAHRSTGSRALFRRLMEVCHA